ncbi:hypothetical protein KIN20_019549, partial [Parelaphostrongylus tenuis]
SMSHMSRYYQANIMDDIVKPCQRNFQNQPDFNSTNTMTKVDEQVGQHCYAAY